MAPRLAIALGVLLASGVTSHVGAAAPEPLRVLFVGNSYTRFNVMPQLVRRLAQHANAPLELNVETRARAGYTLRMHWRGREVRERIRRGRFTHVVLQDHSLRPLDHAGEFEEYVGRFKREADRVGSRTVLYQTWARHPGAPLYRKHASIHTPVEMDGHVAGAYTRLAEALGANVAPVGAAFSRALGARPNIPLYKPDGTHPTWAGSYLAACVIYGTITGRDPRSSGYHPWELDAASAESLRELAAHVLGAGGAPGRP